MAFDKSRYLDIVRLSFIAVVTILSLVSLLGVWEVLDKDVVTKSFQTLGILALISIIIMVASRFTADSQDAVFSSSEVSTTLFTRLRKITLVALSIAVVLLGLVGVLAIWEILQDRENLYKTVSSIAVLVFAAVVIVFVCTEREGWNLFGEKNRSISIGGVILFLIMFVILLNILRR